MRSIWNDTVKRPTFAPLEGDHKTDVLIIGGGITGILCAHKLRQAGVDCMLVEAEHIGSGITTNTTAKLTIQHGLLYDRLIRRFGTEAAQQYATAQTEALAAYRRLAQIIACDFVEQNTYVYTRTDRRMIEREATALQRIHIPATVCDELPLPIGTRGAVCVPQQAQFHPLKFLFSVAEGLPIYEHTRVTAWSGDAVKTDHGSITARAVIVATHFPMFNKHGGYFIKLYQHRSYVLALKNAPIPNGAFVDESQNGLSFRSYGDTLLLGGGAHRTGKQGGGWQELTEFTARRLPTACEVGRWATQDCMTADGLPYIGQYAKNTPNVYVATGFNKWGMTSAMVAATLLTDLVQGKDNPYVTLFSPSRSLLRPQIAVNAVQALVHLLTPTAPRCPHMGCALKYNRQEHSWDCPCHGSRFAKGGALLDNPATDDLP